MCKETKSKFYFTISVHYKKYIRVFSQLSCQCTLIYSYRLALFVQCIAQTIRNSDLLEFLRHLYFLKSFYIFIFNSVGQQYNDLPRKIKIFKISFFVLRRAFIVLKLKYLGVMTGIEPAT